MADPSTAKYPSSGPRSEDGGNGIDRDATPRHPAQSPRALTVLIAVPTLESGASDLNALTLTQYLASHGHHPIVVSQGGRLVPEIVAVGGDLSRVGVNDGVTVRAYSNTVLTPRVVGVEGRFKF